MAYNISSNKEQLEPGYADGIVQILAGLIDETQNGPQRLFTTVFGIVPLAAALLVAKIVSAVVSILIRIR